MSSLISYPFCKFYSVLSSITGEGVIWILRRLAVNTDYAKLCGCFFPLFPYSLYELPVCHSPLHYSLLYMKSSKCRTNFHRFMYIMPCLITGPVCACHTTNLTYHFSCTLSERIECNTADSSCCHISVIFPCAKI